MLAVLTAVAGVAGYLRRGAPRELIPWQRCERHRQKVSLMPKRS